MHFSQRTSFPSPPLRSAKNLEEPFRDFSRGSPKRLSQERFGRGHSPSETETLGMQPAFTPPRSPTRRHSFFTPRQVGLGTATVCLLLTCLCGITTGLHPVSISQRLQGRECAPFLEYFSQTFADKVSTKTPDRLPTTSLETAGTAQNHTQANVPTAAGTSTATLPPQKTDSCKDAYHQRLLIMGGFAVTSLLLAIIAHGLSQAKERPRQLDPCGLATDLRILCTQQTQDSHLFAERSHTLLASLTPLSQREGDQQEHPVVTQEKPQARLHLVSCSDSPCSPTEQGNSI